MAEESAPVVATEIKAEVEAPAASTSSSVILPEDEELAKKCLAQGMDCFLLLKYLILATLILFPPSHLAFTRYPPFLFSSRILLQRLQPSLRQIPLDRYPARSFAPGLG